MTNNNYDFERNLHLTGIEKNTRGIKTAMEDKLYLDVYGKEAYLEMVEKRRFRKQIIWSSIGAFLVGFFGVGLYMCNFSMTTLFTRLVEFFMNLF